MRVSRWGVSFAVVFCVALGQVSGASARGHLDPSFGEGGVVDITDDLSSKGWLGAFVPAADRGIYFSEARPNCRSRRCTYPAALKRYRPNGTVDSRFGPDGRPLRIPASSESSIIADPFSRLLVAWEKAPRGQGFYVRRLRKNGTVDRSFGSSGTVFLDCGCYLDSMVTVPGGYLLVSGYSEKRVPGKGVKTRWFFARLRASGRPDRSFGRGGEAWVSMRAYWVPDAVVPLRDGSTWLAGFRERHYDNTAPYVLRMSGNGEIARRFARTARRSLAGLYQTGLDDVGWESLSLIPRSRGRVDLYGNAYQQGVALRLRRDGRRDRSFGRKGTSLLPFEASDVVSDGLGGAFAVGFRRGHYSVLRVEQSGRVDRGFGRVRLPGAYNEYGLSIFASRRNEAVVLARGESICRGSCPSNPMMYRLVGD